MNQALNLQESLLSVPPKNGNFYTLAIDGRGGCGKSTLIEYLQTQYPDWMFLEGDDYFEPTNDPVAWGAFNETRFRKEVIEPLQSGNTFIHKKYDWHNASQPVKITVDRVFCLERCFSFEFNLDWDFKIWVETPKEVCFNRGLKRDSHDLGADRATKAWRIWQEKEDEYIVRVQPLKIADFIVDGTKPIKKQIV